MKEIAIRFIFCLLAPVILLFNCSVKSGLEDGMLGTWKTTDPEYLDTYFELHPERIVFKDREGGTQSYSIIKVKRETCRNSQWLACSVTYQNAELQRSEFSFFYQQEPVDTIILKNQDKLIWKKEGHES